MTSGEKPTTRWDVVGPRAMVMMGVDGDLLSGVEVPECVSGGVDGGV